MKRWLVQASFPVLVTISFASIGCSSSSTSGADGGGPIVLGAVLSQNGDCGPYGFPEWQSMEMAIDEINDAGGVLGRPLSAVLKDDQTIPDASITGAQALAALGVGAIVGGTCSSLYEAVATVTIPDGITLISPSASAAAITGLHDAGGLTFRTINNDSIQAPVLTELAEDAGIKTMAVIYDQTETYSIGLSQGIQDGFLDAGGTITSVTPYTPNTTGDYTETVRAALGGSVVPQAVALFGYIPDAPNLLNDYVDNYKSENIFWLLSDTLPYQSFVQDLGANAGTFTIRGTSDAPPSSAIFNAYQTNFFARYGANASDAYGPNAYDAVYMLALAIQQQGKTDGVSIAKGLTAIGTGNGAAVNPGTFTTAIADLKAGQAVKYTGASGNCTFDANGNVDDGYEIWTVADGGIEPLIPSVFP